MRRWNAVIGISAVVIAAGLGARPPHQAASPVVGMSAAQLEQRSSNRSLAGLLGTLPCSPRALPTLIRPAGADRTTPGSLTCLSPVDFRMVDVFRAHNETRQRFGSQPLVWDPKLAAQAQVYAVHLSRTGRLVHSPRAGRGNARENLTRGLPGWTGRQLVGIWLDERRYFRPGVFPHVTTTGRWEDVAHFTQMVWPTTTTLGCGIADGSGHRWMVCHYAPGGNRDGVLISPTSTIAQRP